MSTVAARTSSNNPRRSNSCEVSTPAVAGGASVRTSAAEMLAQGIFDLRVRRKTWLAIEDRIRGRDGTDRLSGIEILRFTDGAVEAQNVK